MLNKSDGKIGLRGIIAIFCMTMGFKLTDMTPTILFDEGKNATWMIPIIGAMIIIGPFLVLSSLLKKYKDKGLIDLIYVINGKYVGFFLAFSFFLIALSGTVFNTRSYADIINTMFFPRTPLILIYIQGIAVSYFIANRGLETIGRIAWYFFITIKASLILIVIFAWKDLDITFLFPIWGPGKAEVMKSGISNITLLGEMFLITILYQYTRNHKVFKKGTLIGLILTVFELSLFFAIYTIIFDYNGAEKLSFPFQQLTMYINSERFFTNLESLFLPFWIIGSSIRYSIYLYFTSAALGYTLKLKEFEPLILPLSTIILLLGLLPETTADTVLIYRGNYFYKTTWIFFIALPFMLWIIDKLRGEVKE